MVAGSNTWADAPSIRRGTDSTPTPSAGLTTEAGERFPGNWDLGRSAWWRFDAPVSEMVGIETLWSIWPEGDFPDTVVGVWTGNVLADLTLVAFGDDNDRDIPRIGSSLMTDIDFDAEAGQTYWIQVSSWNGSDDLDYVLRIGKRLNTTSAWIQDPAYEVTELRDHLYHVDHAHGLEDWVSATSGETGLDYVPVEPHIDVVRAATLEQYPTIDTGGGETDHTVSLQYGWDPGTIGGGGWDTIADATTQFPVRAISPFDVNDYGPVGEKPPEAVGYEWAPDPLTGDTFPDDGFTDSVVAAAVLDADSEILVDAHDTRAPGDELQGGFTTALHATLPSGSDFHSTTPGAPTWPRSTDRVTVWHPDFDNDPVVTTIPDQGSGTILVPIGEDLTLTPYLDELGRVALYTHTTDVIDPYDTTPGTGNGGDLSYGWVLWDHTIRWTFTPRPYRWRLRTVQMSDSYRRTSARHDGVAGGAGRNWPPSKSHQASNRTSGGYL